MAVKKEIKIDVNTKSAEQNVEDLNKEINNTDEAIGGLTGAVDKLTGGMVSGFKNGVKGIKQGITAMKSLKVAIAATGIGALLIAITALTSYFTKTQRGADKLKQVMDGLGAAIDVIVDRLSKTGEAFTMILSGNFKGAFEEFRNVFKGTAEEIRNEASAAAQLAKELQNLEDREIAMIETRAQRRADIEALRLAAADENNTLAERAKALKDAIELEKQLADEEVAIAEERARIIKAQNALGESSREDVKAEAEATARVIELQAQRDTRLKELVTTYNSLNKQHAEQVRLLREEESAVVELNAKRIDSKQLAVDNELQMHQMLRTNMLGIDQQYEAQRQKIQADGLKKTRSQKMAELEVVGSTLGAIGRLAGDNAQAGKALSAAEAIINTYTGATKALAQGGIAGPIAAAGVIASGLASVRAIYATDIPSTASSGVSVGGRNIGGRGGSPAVNIPRPQSPRTSFDTTASTLGNQIAESIAKTPVKAYVVSQEVQSAAQLNRKIRETATIG